MILLTACALVTGLVTEAIKKMFSNKANIVAAIVSIVVSWSVGVGYVVYNDIAFNTQIIILLIVLVIGSWLCAMVGYDKVVQTIKQIAGKEDANEL